MIKNIDYIEFYDTLENLLKTSKLVYSSSLNHELLATTGCEFIDDVEAVHVNGILDKESDDTFDKSISDIIDSIMYHQISPSTEKGSNKEYYTFIGNSKVISINLEPGIGLLKLFFTDGTFRVFDVMTNTGSNRLLLLIESSTKIDSIADKVHEYSIKPHQSLEKDVLTYNTLNTILKSMFIDNLVDNRNNMLLGFSIEDHNLNYEDSLEFGSLDVTYDNVKCNWNEIVITYG